MSIFKKSKSKRTTFTGIEITEKKKHKSDHEFTTDVITFNRSGGVPKGHPFIDREFPGALKVTEDSIEKPVDLTNDMTEEEMKEYFNREWNK
jgi:hypothetical protein